MRKIFCGRNIAHDVVVVVVDIAAAVLITLLTYNVRLFSLCCRLPTVPRYGRYSVVAAMVNAECCIVVLVVTCRENKKQDSQWSIQKKLAKLSSSTSVNKRLTENSIGKSGVGRHATTSERDKLIKMDISTSATATTVSPARTMEMEKRFTVIAENTKAKSLRSAGSSIFDDK